MSIISSSRCRGTGLWNTSESMETCKRFRSTSCKTCYACNRNRRYPNTMNPFNKRIHEAWLNETLKSFNRVWHSKRDQSRFRFAKQGECLCDDRHTDLVYRIIADNPQTLFLCPTRAWKDSMLRKRIDRIRYLPNARVMASIDLDAKVKRAVPSLIADRWSLLFSNPGILANSQGYPDDLFGVPFELCAKTWYADHGKDPCLHCRRGCFSEYNVHLKWHR